jgi:hypothetical protein
LRSKGTGETARRTVEIQVAIRCKIKGGKVKDS